jgi:hypothetical protein
MTSGIYSSVLNTPTFFFDKDFNPFSDQVVPDYADWDSDPTNHCDTSFQATVFSINDEPMDFGGFSGSMKSTMDPYSLLKVQMSVPPVEPAATCASPHQVTFGDDSGDRNQRKSASSVDEVLGEQENHSTDNNNNLSLKTGFIKSVSQSNSGLSHRRLSFSLMPPPPPLTPRPNGYINKSESNLPLHLTSSKPVLSGSVSGQGVSPSVQKLLRSPSLEECQDSGIPTSMWEDITNSIIKIETEDTYSLDQTVPVSDASNFSDVGAVIEIPFSSDIPIIKTEPVDVMLPPSSCAFSIKQEPMDITNLTSSLFPSLHHNHYSSPSYSDNLPQELGQCYDASPYSQTRHLMRPSSPSSSRDSLLSVPKASHSMSCRRTPPPSYSAAISAKPRWMP